MPPWSTISLISSRTEIQLQTAELLLLYVIIVALFFIDQTIMIKSYDDKSILIEIIFNLLYRRVFII